MIEPKFVIFLLLVERCCLFSNGCKLPQKQSVIAAKDGTQLSTYFLENCKQFKSILLL